MSYNTNACKLRAHNIILTGGVDSDFFFTSSLKSTGILGAEPLNSF